MRVENIFLVLGLVFSMILITFRIGDEFIILGTMLELSLVDVASNSSNETYLSSVLIGYLFFVAFGLIVWKKVSRKGKPTLVLFSLLTIIGIIFELITFYESSGGIYSGKHFRIGITLAIIGFIITNQINLRPNSVNQ